MGCAWRNGMLIRFDMTLERRVVRGDQPSAVREGVGLPMSHSTTVSSASVGSHLLSESVTAMERSQSCPKALSGESG